MSKLEFSIRCSIPQDKLIEMTTDYENIDKFFPPQMKCKIIKKHDNTALLEQELSVSVLKQKIIQQSIHRVISPDLLETEIVSGPAKGTIAKISFKNLDAKTQITIRVDLKLGLRYKLLASFIKRKYQVILNSLLNKIIGIAMLTENKSWTESKLDGGNGIILSINGVPPLKFYGWWYSELKQMFVDELYRDLPVQGKTVVDVGANIGDSSIYFVTKGAAKVVAIEPFPTNFELGKKNIEDNNLSERITFMHVGIADQIKEIPISAEIENGYTSFHLKAHKNGLKISTLTLQSLVEKFDLKSAVLKLDCEGCEYDAILTSSKEVLSRFDHILVEYHNGHKTLTKKLEDSGFIVRLDKENSNEISGYIYAQRIY